jgi:signal recognition particle subunit SRP54
MADMMKKMGKGKGMLGKLMGGMGGGMPDVDPKQLEEMAKSGQLPDGMELPKGLPGGMPGMGGGGLPPGMPGLPGLGGPKMPGLPGMGKGKKR